ncbi:MAG: hypothetical protein GQ531_00575 [Sulfurovum sp.]|nr:hypothetical protein [Sulfurovum sp.]
MMKVKTTTLLLLCTSVLSLHAAPSTSPSTIPEKGYSYNGVYFGDTFSHDSQEGIIDGCTTAKGSYQKDHALFKQNKDYNSGWFLGRSKCRTLLVAK